MPVVQLLTQLLAGRRVARGVRTLAEVLAAAVQPSLSPRVLAMHRAEARGYIRARTTPVVETEMGRLVLAEPALSSSRRAKIAAELTEQVVQLVFSEVVRGRALRTNLRKAA
jgi:hypothetical protein